MPPLDIMLKSKTTSFLWKLSEIRIDSFSNLELILLNAAKSHCQKKKGKKMAEVFQKIIMTDYSLGPTETDPPVEGKQHNGGMTRGQETDDYSLHNFFHL